MSKLLNDTAFGQNIKKIRIKKGLTQEETVAKMQVLGSPIIRTTYAIIESGKGNVFVSDLVAMQKVFNVDFAEFFEGISTSRKQS